MTKYFLDSSIVQPLLLGSTKYKAHLTEQFANGNLYASQYVQMEVKRSCIVPMIDFYFVLTLPSVETVGDAMSIWSNRFSGREIKAVIRFMGQVIDTHALSTEESKDKAKVLHRLGFIIKRIEMHLRHKFVDIGSNATRCARAQVELVTAQTEDQSLAEQLEQFVDRFNDTGSCRRRCRVDDFLLKRFSGEVTATIQYVQMLSNPKAQHNKGFVEVAENLAKIEREGANACSCRMCGRIGDAIIALETPRSMQLEHTDFSFDQLCTVIKQSHRRHMSEIEFHKNFNQNSSSSVDENE